MTRKHYLEGYSDLMRLNLIDVSSTFVEFPLRRTSNSGGSRAHTTYQNDVYGHHEGVYGDRKKWCGWIRSMIIRWDERPIGIYECPA